MIGNSEIHDFLRFASSTSANTNQSTYFSGEGTQQALQVPMVKTLPLPIDPKTLTLILNLMQLDLQEVSIACFVQIMTLWIREFIRR